MTTRLNPFAAHSNLMKPLIDFGNAAQNGLDPTLIIGIQVVRNPDKLRHLDNESMH
jgi:hypothetical protein